MDTELSPASSEGSLDGRELVMTSHADNSAMLQPSPFEFSPDVLRRARIAVGEYARTSGMYDPVDVLAFTRLCLQEASTRVNATAADQADVLIMEVLSIASASCGVCKPRRGGSMDSPRTTNDSVSQVAAPVLATESFVAAVAEQKPIVAVPTPHERSMPAQPLGELPDVRPARLWNSLVQMAWRSVWSLVNSLFARSE